MTREAWINHFQLHRLTFCEMLSVIRPLWNKLVFFYVNPTFIILPKTICYLCEPSGLFTYPISENVIHKITQNQIVALSPDGNWQLISSLPVSVMFQSFTEGELQHVVETLLDRKRRKGRRLGDNQGRRTKRARRPKPCSLRELELTVSELGLGYESDETVLLRYCSGKCTAHRHNYDITMEHMMRTGFRKKGRKDKVSNGPCCRPTAFEKDFSFLDNKSRYHTIQNVSAKNCGCVWPTEMDS